MARSAFLVVPAMLGVSVLLQGCFEPLQTPCLPVLADGQVWAQLIPALVPGQTFHSNCTFQGFEGPTATVTCNGETGMLEPQPLPVCKRITDWCKAESKDGYTVPSAANQEKVQVHCLEDGLVPLHAEVQCFLSKEFFPIPRCVKPWDTTTTTTTSSVRCPAHMNPPVPETAAGESAPVMCTSLGLGYEAVPPTVTCAETGNFEPEPKCELKKDYCLGKSTGTGGLKYSDAALGATVQVECVEDGYVPESATASCGLYGAFSPTPQCEKQGRRMNALRGGA